MSVNKEDLGYDDRKEIELFETWLARIDVLIQSGIDRNKAQIEAYREIYYPEAAPLDPFEETQNPEDEEIVDDEEIVEYLDSISDEERQDLLDFTHQMMWEAADAAINLTSRQEEENLEYQRELDADLWMFSGNEPISPYCVDCMYCSEPCSNCKP